MAGPTLKDVLDAIAAQREELKSEISQVRSELKGEISQVRSELAQVRSELKGEISQARSELKGAISQARSELEAEIVHVRSDVNTHRAETAQAFAALDKELTTHAGVHRALEKDVELLKRRPTRSAARPTRRR